MNKILEIIIYLINVYLFMGFSEFLSGIQNTTLPNILKYDIYIYISIFIICVMYILPLIFKKKGNILVKHKWTLLFGLCVILITILNTSNKEAIINSLMLFGIIVYCIVFTEMYNTKTILKILVVSQSIVVIITYIAIIKYPEFTVYYETRGEVYKGLFSNKNGLGANMAFTIIIIDIYIRTLKNKISKVKYIGIEVLSILLLILSSSKTSLVICIIPIIIYKLYMILRLRINIAYIISWIYLVVFYFISNAQKFNDIFIKLFNRDLTLTNRTIIWETCFEIIMDKPFIGYGFFNIWNDGNVIGNYIRYNSVGVIGTFSGAHNGFIEWILQIGIIGCFLLIFIILNISKKMSKIMNKYRLEFEFSFKYMLYIMIFYITERTAYYNSFKLVVLFLIISLINKQYYIQKHELSKVMKKNKNSKVV